MTELTRGLTLVLGGTRSGKSGFAEKLVAGYASVAYIATAEAIDAEMAKRIADHQAVRPPDWGTLEVVEPVMSEVIVGLRSEAVLIDSMTLYAATVMESELDPIVHMRDVIEEIARSESAIIVVSDEVGLGVVPPTPEGRAFRDFLGWTNQQLAAVADAVYLVVAGVPMPVKGARDRTWA